MYFYLYLCVFSTEGLKERKQFTLLQHLVKTTLISDNNLKIAIYLVKTERAERTIPFTSLRSKSNSQYIHLILCCRQTSQLKIDYDIYL